MTTGKNKQIHKQTFTYFAAKLSFLQHCSLQSCLCLYAASCVCLPTPHEIIPVTPTWALLPLSWWGLSVKVKVLVPQLCPTLCDPVDSSLSGSSVFGILQVTIQVGLPFPSPGDLPDTGIKPGSPALQMDSLRSEPPGKPWMNPWVL